MVFEQYKLAVEMADRTSARRSAANSFYLTVQGALIAFLGFIAGLDGSPNKWTLVAICMAGLMASAAWFLLLRSYRDLNAAKYKVICDIEELLPVRLFGDEWAELKKDKVKKWRPRYAELGTIERLLPTAFAVLNLMLAIYLGLA